MIDYTIRLGDIVSFFGFAAGGLSVIFMMKGDIRILALRLTGLSNKVDEQGKEIVRFAELLTLMGRYEERFAALRREIDEMKRGRGFILDRRKDEDGKE